MSKVVIGKRQMTRNILMNICAFGMQFVINFYISPIIVRDIDASAYGFMGLANDFVSYASIVSTIFNSVAARFISDAFYRKDYNIANGYFNSLIVTNGILAIIFSLVGIIFIPYLNYILNVPESIIYDVKITFALVFGAYIVNLITNVFTTSTFITNRTDIQGTRNIINYIIRFSGIVLLLNFVSVKIQWIALSTFIASTVVALINIRLTKVLTPELKINKKYVNSAYVIELAKSGFWMAITSMSTILMRGLDLIFANKLLGAYDMGILSIAATMPNNVTAVINTLAPLFTPTFIMLFAKGDINKLKKEINTSVFVMSTILFVPISGFIFFSYDFYSLWQNSITSQEVVLVTILSNITIVQAFFNASTASLAQVSVVTNQLKIPVLVSLGCGIINIISIFILLKLTDLGLYAIVLSSTTIIIFRYLFFNPMYVAKCINVPKREFYKSTLKTWGTIPIIMVSMYIVKSILPAIHSWRMFCIEILICGLIGYAEMLVIFTKGKRKNTHA